MADFSFANLLTLSSYLKASAQSKDRSLLSIQLVFECVPTQLVNVPPLVLEKTGYKAKRVNP